MTNEIDWQTADLNEAGEWVEVPAESLLPKCSLRYPMKKGFSDKTIHNYLSNMNYYLLFLKYNASPK